MRIALMMLVAAAALPAQDEHPMTPKVGDPAPAFRLNDQYGAGVAPLADPQSKWTVLAFFPKADTPG